MLKLYTLMLGAKSSSWVNILIHYRSSNNLTFCPFIVVAFSNTLYFIQYVEQIKSILIYLQILDIIVIPFLLSIASHVHG